MDVLEAIQTRKSVRAFTPAPVPVETISKLLEIAQRAPSGTNTQPWHVYVCTGEVKRAITADVLDMARAGAGKGYEDFDYYPAIWKEVHNSRRREVGWSLYNLVGVEKGDREGSARQAMRNFLFFDAPVGIFVTVDSYLRLGSWSDTGMYIQTIMLAAKGLGLDTCPQAAWIPYQEPVRHHLGIPEDQSLVTGMSLGFADPDKIENTLVSEREAVENVVHYCGFE
ncbi:MAG: nitroreductase [Actinomycetota bacterium]|nr:nitroreductase [Actinomycetota bacterium]